MVCQVINRTLIPRMFPHYNDRVAILNKYLGVVLDTVGFAEFRHHKGLRKPDVSVLCGDRIHLNAKGLYALYRSYRGATLRALKKI